MVAALAEIKNGMKRKIKDAEDGIENNAADAVQEISALKEAAMNVQSRTTFDARRVFEALIHPKAFNRKDLAECCEETLILYEDAGDGALVQSFNCDFKYSG